jgi:hypothetical protein
MFRPDRPLGRPLHDLHTVCIKAVNHSGLALAVFKLRRLSCQLYRLSFVRTKSPGWRSGPLNAESLSSLIPNDREFHIVYFAHDILLFGLVLCAVLVIAVVLNRGCPPFYLQYARRYRRCFERAGLRFAYSWSPSSILCRVGHMTLKNIELRNCHLEAGPSCR